MILQYSQPVNLNHKLTLILFYILNIINNIEQSFLTLLKDDDTEAEDVDEGEGEGDDAEPDTDNPDDGKDADEIFNDAFNEDDEDPDNKSNPKKNPPKKDEDDEPDEEDPEDENDENDEDESSEDDEPDEEDPENEDDEDDELTKRIKARVKEGRKKAPKKEIVEEEDEEFDDVDDDEDEEDEPAKKIELDDVIKTLGDEKAAAVGVVLEDYPEIGDLFKAVIEVLSTEEEETETEQEKKSTKKSTAKAQEKAANTQAKKNNVRFWIDMEKINPDAKEIAQSPAFDRWLAKQDEHMQEWAGGLDISDSTLVLDAYEASVARVKNKKTPGDKKKSTKKKLSQTSIRGGKTPKPKGSGDNKSFDDHFNEAVIVD